jgi:hypothetical protein
MIMSPDVHLLGGTQTPPEPAASLRKRRGRQWFESVGSRLEVFNFSLAHASHVGRVSIGIALPAYRHTFFFDDYCFLP